MNSYDWRISDFQTCEMSHSVHPHGQNDLDAFGCLTLLTKTDIYPASELKMFFDDPSVLDRLITEAFRLRTALILELTTCDIRYPQDVPARTELDLKTKSLFLGDCTVGEKFANLTNRGEE